MDLQIGCHHGTQAKGSSLPINLQLQLQRVQLRSQNPRMAVEYVPADCTNGTKWRLQVDLEVIFSYGSLK